MEEQIAAVRRMQSYIETHLDEEITLSGLARALLFALAFPPAVRALVGYDSRRLYPPSAAVEIGSSFARGGHKNHRRGVQGGV